MSEAVVPQEQPHLLPAGPGDVVMTSGLSIEVAFTIRRRDLFWMFMGSLMPRLMAASMACLFGGILALWQLGLAHPNGTKEDMAILGVLAMLVSPFLSFWMFARVAGWSWLVGQRASLHIDQNGLTGWPLEPACDRSWPAIHLVRELHGVITLPFGGVFDARRGWVAIPRDALTLEQAQFLDSVFASHGLTKDSAARMLRGHPGLSPSEAWLDPKVLIRRGPIRSLLHYHPIVIGDTGIKAPPHPAYRWSEIASMDVDPRRPHILRLWLYDELTGAPARDPLPSRVDLGGYVQRPSRVQAEIESAFKAYQRSAET